MFQDSNALVVVETAECPIRRGLAQLAANLDTRFLRAGTTLAEAIGMIDRIVGGLDTIVDALDASNAGAAAADLTQVAERITALPAALAGRTGRIKTIAGIAALLRQHVLDMHRSLRVLGIYGMNIKIAASGEPQFVGFVNGMNGKLAAGETLLTEVISKLKELETGLASVQQVDRLLTAECVKAVPAVPQRLAADAAALGVHLQGAAQLARRVAAIARSIQTKVAVLLGALQVGDSTRQRLEHVVAALQLVESHGCGPGAAAHVDRLLSAQLDAVVHDFGRETGALVASLDALIPDGHALLDLIAEQAGEDNRGFLTRLEESVTGMDRIIVQLQSAHQQAEGMTGLIDATVTELTQRVGRLSAIRTDVQDIATNTRLLCRRHGAVGRAVAVVAQEVDAYARDLGATTIDVGRTIGRLGDAEVSLALGDDEPDVATMLARALLVIRKACRRTEQVVLQGGDDAQRLVELVEATAVDLAQELSLTGTMEEASAILAERASDLPELTPDDEGALHAVLPTIAKLYTMAAERDVHARFLLPGMATTAHAANDDDDDDGLF
ncbi:hypothetical protein SFC76_11940 [Sphingomonas sp. CD22]|uniref:hypothetical protein n=1 Tax=Sphingomonas sp. CD22 TaxID=3100214 RepID=UPI002AE09AF1|nr:hypothetical protein [Sphingomonas sp. CD22]MEA1084972.1 hypothetical protein [Sphingomonas sp. CD22]